MATCSVFTGQVKPAKTSWCKSIQTSHNSVFTHHRKNIFRCLLALVNTISARPCRSTVHPKVLTTSNAPRPTRPNQRRDIFHITLNKNVFCKQSVFIYGQNDFFVYRYKWLNMRILTNTRRETNEKDTPALTPQPFFFLTIHFRPAVNCHNDKAEFTVIGQNSWRIKRVLRAISAESI